MNNNDPINVLQPNSLGDSLGNRGVDELVANRGLGVQEAEMASPRAMRQRDETSNPEMMKDKLRTAKAREFGLTKSTVGF